MQTQLIELLRSMGAAIAGAAIGLVFRMMQEAALRRNQKLLENGKLNRWAGVPRSGQRVACLLIALALVQLVCPLLFVNGCQWWVSAGVVVGYGFILYRQLRQKASGRN